MRILGSKSGFRTGRDLLTYAIGIAGLVYVLTRPGGTANYPGITLFLGVIGAPYILQRDEKKPPDEPEPEPEPIPKPRRKPTAQKTAAKKVTVTKKRQP